MGVEIVSWELEDEQNVCGMQISLTLTRQRRTEEDV